MFDNDRNSEFTLLKNFFKISNNKFIELVDNEYTCK